MTYAPWCGFSAVSAWIAVRVVAVVRLIAFRFAGPGLLTTTMEHRGGQDHDNGTLPWLRRPGIARGAGTGGAGAAAEARSAAGPPARKGWLLWRG
jgi:hypothetical protein